MITVEQCLHMAETSDLFHHLFFVISAFIWYGRGREETWGRGGDATKRYQLDSLGYSLLNKYNHIKLS